MTDDDERNAPWRPDWGGPDPVAMQEPSASLFPPVAAGDGDEPIDPEEVSGSLGEVSAWAPDEGAADDASGSGADVSPWAPEDGSGAPAPGLLSSPASPISSVRARVPDLRPAESPWSFPAPSGDHERPEDPASGAAIGEPADASASSTDATSVDVHTEAVPIDATSGSGRARQRLGRSRAFVVAAVVVAVVAGLVIVRDLVGDSTQTVAGVRLPAAIDERWSISLEDRFVTDAAVTDDAVVVASGRWGPGGLDLIGYDAADGTERWREGIESVSIRLDVVDDDLVVVSGIGDVRERRSSLAIEPRTGERRWERGDVSVVLTRPEMGTIALVDASEPSAFEPELELIDLRSGETISPIEGRLVGLDSSGDVFSLDVDGSVRRLAVSAHSEETTDEVDSTIVATTSPDRSNVFELAGRYFAPSDGVIVEVGFVADAGRVLLDRRPDDQQESPLPTIEESSFFVSVDDRHAVMLGGSQAMGVELEGDELRARWSATSPFGLPWRVDGNRVVLEVGSRRDGGGSDAAMIDAVTGERIVELPGAPVPGGRKPVDGTFSVTDAVDSVGAGPDEVGAVVALDLQGRTRWTLEDVSAGPFTGDRTVVIARRDGGDATIVFYDEGPRSRD